MSDFLEEVKEDLKIEKWMTLWKKHQNNLIGGLVLSFLVGGGIVYWNHHTQTQNENWSQLYEQGSALAREGKVEEAISILGQLHKAGKGYSGLSDLAKVAILQANPSDDDFSKNREAAYTSLMENSKAETSFRELATLLKAWNQLDQSVEKDVLEKLTFIGDSTSIWRALAAEVLGLNALKSAEPQKARELFEKVKKDPMASQELQARVSAILNRIPTS
ncbi:MAG: tetratricopeptide repeat protein [bacterium]|nr:tetratricopeptide repeat protein [bacterium]